jgi:hypothetical protein
VTKVHIVTGRILAVQEERLRIVTDTGQCLLLTLLKNARLPAGLAELQRTQAQVRVEYRGEPNLASGVVWRIQYI